MSFALSANGSRRRGASMAYKQVYTIKEQNEILKEGGEQAIFRLWQAYEKQINDFVVHIMLGYGQKPDRGKIEDCQSAAKVKVCEIIWKKPQLTSDFMAYIQEAVIHAVENELFGQDHIVQGQRNLLKRAKVQKARETLIKGGNLNPTPEEIFEEINSMFENTGKIKDGKAYPDITIRFIRNILVKTVSLDDFNEGTMPESQGKGLEEQAQDCDFSRAVQRVFSVLDERNRTILVLQGEGVSQKQIAKELGMEPVEYRFRKNVLETYLAAALMCLGYQDVTGLASHRFDVAEGNYDENVRHILASMNAEEQKVLMGILFGKKKSQAGKAGKMSEKVLAVFACMASLDEELGGRYGYGEIYRKLFQ